MSAKELRLAVVGAGGRMGRQLIQAISQQEGTVLGAAFERTNSSLIGSMRVNWLALVILVSQYPITY